MITDKDISLLLDIHKGSIKIGTEFNNENFVFGSFSYFVQKNLLDKLDNSMFDHRFKQLIDLLKDYKSMFKGEYSLESIEPTSKFYMAQSHLDKTIHLINNQELIDSTIIYFSEWEDFSNLLNVDIANEKIKFYEYLKELESYLLPVEFVDEVLNIRKMIIQLNNTDDTWEAIGANLAITPEFYKIKHRQLYDFINDPSTFSNKNDLSDIKNLIDKDKIIETIKNIYTVFYNIECKINIEHPNVLESKADEYAKIINNNQSSVNEFMVNKFLDTNSNNFIELSKTNKYSKFVYFEQGNSISVQTRDKEVFKIGNSHDASLLIVDIFKYELANILRKKPTVAKMFLNILSSDPSQITGAIIAANTYLNNENILKSNNFEITESNNSSFEELDDSMNNCIKTHKSKQYAHSIASNKYLHLYNSASYHVIKQIEELGIDVKFLQDSIGKKIAGFKDSNSFNEALTRMYNSYSDFSMENMLIKSSSNNVEIISNEDNILILKIENFDQSKRLGSSSWCISRDDYYFNSYTKDGNQQYFIFNFNKTSSDHESMIGLTLLKDGKYSTSHLKNDSHYSVNPFLEDIQLKIISNKPELFPNLDADLRTKLESILKTKNISNGPKI